MSDQSYVHLHIQESEKNTYYTQIAFDERVTFFGFNAPGHCLVHARLLHCICVILHNGYMRAYAEIMQHRRTHMT